MRAGAVQGADEVSDGAVRMKLPRRARTTWPPSSEMTYLRARGRACKTGGSGKGHLDEGSKNISVDLGTVLAADGAASGI